LPSESFCFFRNHSACHAERSISSPQNARP